MEPQVKTAIRLPRRLIKDLKKIAHDEGSTYNQLIRSAAIQIVKDRKQTAA